MYKFLISVVVIKIIHIFTKLTLEHFSRGDCTPCASLTQIVKRQLVVLPRLKLLSSTNLRNSSGIPWIFGWNTFGGAVATMIRKFAWSGLSGWTAPFFGGLPEPRTLMAPFFIARMTDVAMRSYCFRVMAWFGNMATSLL